jgi:hypothetical protein
MEGVTPAIIQLAINCILAINAGHIPTDEQMDAATQVFCGMTVRGELKPHTTPPGGFDLTKRFQLLIGNKTVWCNPAPPVSGTESV